MANVNIAMMRQVFGSLQSLIHLFDKQLIRNACIDLSHDSLNSLRIRSQLIDQFKHSHRGIAGVRWQMLATAECAFDSQLR